MGCTSEDCAISREKFNACLHLEVIVNETSCKMTNFSARVQRSWTNTTSVEKIKRSSKIVSKISGLPILKYPLFSRDQKEFFRKVVTLSYNAFLSDLKNKILLKSIHLVQVFFIL